MKKAVITVTGKDMVGILARVAGICAQDGANVLEVSQTVLCEDKAPVIKAALPGGFGVWRQESADIEIYVEDT